MYGGGETQAAPSRNLHSGRANANSLNHFAEVLLSKQQKSSSSSLFPQQAETYQGRRSGSALSMAAHQTPVMPRKHA